MHTTRMASVLIGLVAAGMLVLGAGQAAAAESGIGQPVPAGYTTPIPAAAADEVYGPYEFQSECLSAGNQGMDDGRWSDYECNGSYGAWYLHPSYD
jgi:hypothetical protein